MVVLMIAGLGLMIWGGVYNYHERQQKMQAARESQIKLVKDGDSSATMTMQGSSDSLGKDLRNQPAPAFKLATLEGGKFDSASLKGHPMVINFWATYCGPCRLEMPWFEEFSKKYEAKGLKVVGIDDEEGASKDDIHAAVKKTGVTYPILIADTSIEKAYGLGDYLPSTYYVDANGKVLIQTPGAPSKDEIEANIQKIIGGQ
ncbi:TlpA family protein disulfide reductase [Granulicella cerasi]|uniref:TlpA family protein disulfide reductase n=1 Tax=Granulicella cerasi TaxID=741063 RepID=UPI0021DF457A|nr:TlpA disulfide reductase family protein [Granulicella cerasi]